MREIGGYIELDSYHLPMLHEGALALNCGRNALAYLLKSHKIRKLWLPKLICDSVTGVCERERIPYDFYNIGLDLLPAEKVTMAEGEWFYFVNYYSQFANDIVYKIVSQYQRVIVDQTQSYFQEPLSGVDTLYSCRKYFGVSDGAFLYTNSSIADSLEQDYSYERMHFILGRYEHSANEFYKEFVENNNLFFDESIKKMSKLTYNLLHGIDYDHVRMIRENNYGFLYSAFGDINRLTLNNKKGTFMYPLLLKNGAEIRKKLLGEKIYIPMLWPNVLDWTNKDDLEYNLAANILPLPIDQRYEVVDMERIVGKVFEYYEGAKK